MNRSRLSTDVRILLDPAAAFREQAAKPADGGWVLLRRPLLLAFMFGFAVSMQTSGRPTVRLIVDGVISFAFVPFFEALALAVVYTRAPRRVPLSRAIDLFFAANAPWLLWMLGFSVLRSVLTPVQATAPPPALFWTVVASMAAIAIWSAAIDLEFFREVLPRSDAGPGRDLIAVRAISWLAILLYFFGIAALPELVGRLPA